MKTFLFSVSVLALITIIILCNAFYVRSVTEEMQRDLEKLSSCDQAPSQAILTHWHSKEGVLELSVSAMDMNEVSNHLTELCVAARLNDKEAFERARALCLDSIARIRELERFSFLHIL